MKIYRRKIVYGAVILIAFLFMGGCDKPARRSEKPEAIAPDVDLGATIGSLAEVFSLETIPVEGYGLVGGLSGTGSSECPPSVRTYLKQHILQELPEQNINVEKLINSPDTALVIVQGLMPASVSKNQYFDVRVITMPGTQTTSLENGWLYSADLKAAGRLNLNVKTLAAAEGPIFMDKISGSNIDKKEGYILAGGTALDEYGINVVLRQPDYKVASLIRNCLNERFGSKMANAVSPGRIRLKVPPRYKGQKQRFISIIKATYLTQTAEVTRQRIRSFVRKLAVSDGKYNSEIALEAIGRESIGKLTALLNSSGEQVRLCAARCLLNLGSDNGLGSLRQIAGDKESSYRIEALEAITNGAGRNAAAAISRRLLRDENFDIRLAAYEQLRKLDDISITRKLIARNFYLEQISQTGPSEIFVSRSGQPRIVLFGAPIYCRDNIFVQSANSDITIDAAMDQKYVSIIYKHPKHSHIIVKLRSSFELGDIIQTLCEEPLIEKDGQGYRGLNVSYADMIALLKRMCDKAAVQAEFHAGPMPKISLNVKK